MGMALPGRRPLQRGVKTLVAEACMCLRRAGVFEHFQLTVHGPSISGGGRRERDGWRRSAQVGMADGFVTRVQYDRHRGG